MESKDGLETVLSSFEPVEVQAWMDKIVSDLRGKSLDDVSWAYDNDLSISPLAPRPDGPPEGVDIGFSADWEVAEEIHLTEPKKTNEVILNALKGGCETILLKVNEPTDWRLIFNGVHLEMIRTYIILPDEKEQAIIASLNHWMSGENIADGLIRVRSTQIATLGAAHETRELTTVDLLVKTIRQGMHSIESNDEDDVIECVAELGPYFFIEVARLRALRILWANVLDALDRKGPELFVEARMAEKFLSEDQHANMIAAGTKALAAICGNADRIVLNNNGKSQLESRVARNVHHILRYESKLNSIPDPVRGSFYFEKLTEELVSKSWAKLISD